MNALKASPSQYAALNGYQNGINRIEFVKRGADWIVSVDVLTDPAFSGVAAQLASLQVIELVDKEEAIDMEGAKA